MNRHAYLILAFLATYCPAAPTQQDKGDTPDIDFVAATFHGKPLFDLSLDQLTDILGRPASIRPPNTPLSGEKKKGAMLAYFDKGLLFGCEHPDIDANQTVKAVQVYLARTRPSSGTPFAAFAGTLSYGLSGDWKVPRVLETLAQYKPKDMYDPEKAKTIKALQETARQMDELTRKAGGTVRGSPPEEDNPLTRILLVTPKASVEFAYEENTKFIEWFLITR